MILLVLFAFSCDILGSLGPDLLQDPETEDPADQLTTYTNTNLPARYAVTIPASIMNNVGGIAQAMGMTHVAAKAISPGSIAYMQLVNEVGFMQQFMQQFEIEFMMWDAAYDDVMTSLNNASGIVPAGTLTVTITQAMYNSFIEAVPAEMAQFAPPVGTVIPVPEVEVILDPADADNDG